MTHFDGLSDESGLSDVFNLFPSNSPKLLRLLNDIMCADKELSRGQREAIAAFTSKQNNTPYCVVCHSTFAEAFSGSIEKTNEQIQPLLNYARALTRKDNDEIGQAFEAARAKGWSQMALYEVVEICGIFSYINTIVLAAGLRTPEASAAPAPSSDDLKASYAAMADAVQA